MAIKLTKAEEKTLREHVEAVQSAWATVQEAKTTCEEAITLAVAPLNDAIHAYESVRSDAADFREGLANRLRAEFDEKSEAWQTGDKGSDAEEFIQQWEGCDAEEISEVDAPEIPVDDAEFPEALAGLPSEPE